MSDVWLFQPTAGAIFDSGDLQSIGLRVAQKKKFEKFFFGNFQKISKVSKNIFWASYDHVVAQKSIFWTKISKKVVNTLIPPAWLATAVIYHHSGQYRLLYRNLKFWLKSIFWRILGCFTSKNMIWHLAGSGRKYDELPEIISLDLQNTPKELI